MIFLLKGFFDSLPQELFEAGQLDGAKEVTMMMRIALPLSKPVLGYLALLAFMGAYGAFLYAFLVVQDQKMWTLMVWIYQLQNTAPKAAIMAALTISRDSNLVGVLSRATHDHEGNRSSERKIALEINQRIQDRPQGPES